jgi:cobalamin biosynthesis protein CobD/CbiB
MAESKDPYPVATLHNFIEELSQEFRRLRIQATVVLIGGVFLLIFFVRLVLLFYETARLRSAMSVPLSVDVALLVIALAIVLWSLDFWRHQRKFVARWGKRFEKLEVIEDQLLSE